MADYIQFLSPDGNPMLVEVTEDETQSEQGVQKAGLKDKLGRQMAVARTSFEDAIKHTIHHNANAFIQSVCTLPTLPSEAEMIFGLKVTGEAGNMAVAKIGGEANYTIRLTRQRETKDKSLDEY
jgi:hypothetical protein